MQFSSWYPFSPFFLFWATAIENTTLANSILYNVHFRLFWYISQLVNFLLFKQLKKLLHKAASSFLKRWPLIIRLWKWPETKMTISWVKYAHGIVYTSPCIGVLMLLPLVDLRFLSNNKWNKLANTSFQMLLSIADSQEEEGKEEQGEEKERVH